MLNTLPEPALERKKVKIRKLLFYIIFSKIFSEKIIFSTPYRYVVTTQIENVQIDALDLVPLSTELFNLRSPLQKSLTTVCLVKYILVKKV